MHRVIRWSVMVLELTFLIRRMWKHKSWESGIVAIIASKVHVTCERKFVSGPSTMCSEQINYTVNKIFSLLCVCVCVVIRTSKHT